MKKRLWNLVEFPFHPEKLHHNESLMCIGNGYLSTRAGFEEGYPRELVTTMVHGIFDHAPDMLVPELVNAPNWLPIKITIDGTPFQLVNQNSVLLNPPNGALLGYRRTLHLNAGVLERECLFRAASGALVRLVFNRFTSLHDEHVLAQQVEITAVDGNPTIDIEAYIDPHVTNAGVQHWTDIQTTVHAPCISVSATTAQSGYQLAMAQQLIGEHAVDIETDGIVPVLHTQFTLQREETTTLQKITTIYTSRDTDNPLEAALQKLTEATYTGYEALLEAHQREWDVYWATSDVQIEGDELAQLAVRFAMYHSLIPAPRHDDDVSIGAKTLSGLGYKGHVFWDTELFILPPLILTQPLLARNLLMYRYHRLEGARAKAKSQGYEGAMFPWESTDTGHETTPQWSDVQPDGSRIRIWTGDSEQHISTDIAYAIWQYWNWTGDDEFLAQYGAEIVLDTAKFWGSRVEAKNGHYELSQQIGPDEYHENIDNSVFTNRMVVWHLEHALSLLGWLKEQAPTDYARLVNALDLHDQRLAHWRSIIEKMYIPFDAEKRIHLQFPAFFDMEYIPVPNYQPRTASVQAMLGHQRTIQSQVIKQADVVMLMALLGESLASKDILLNNWNTYYPRTDHGSSLSPAVHAWVAARLGLDDTAFYMFEHAAVIDLQDNKGNVRDGIHGAANGGLYQAIVFGFVGLKIEANGELSVSPRFPEHWKRIAFTVYYRGEKRHFDLLNPAIESLKA